MKKISIFLFLSLSLGVFSYAQKYAKKTEVKPDQKKTAAGVELSTATVSVPAKPSAKEGKSQEKKSVKTAREPAEEEEYSEVMVDTSEPDAYRSAYFKEEKNAVEKEDAAAIPYVYGSLRGSFNEGAKNIMVFENEEGVITFIQVFLEKNSVSWKFLSQINRN
ncbi:MAG: hypothetical protein COT17_08150 [Elusimicrobia bacterium CG08_land_8_20_14_0_20_51_18]|nr:MAG: hypothetical protein COT17_08150 [Elusimicrobia bacterium CG08_land_8_20_14_0_20_51_18]